MTKREIIHLTEEELLDKLPTNIGNISLDYKHYPGKDLYSDGDIEDEMLAIVKDYATVEFPRVIEERNSWPILYHLSPLRSNIVDWMPIDKNARVLEIGSGCGAITGKLAEKAGSVTCVDLSAKRSHINAYRNQDKENITIHVGNFSDIEPELDNDYDYACMIGVFEYGQSYMASQTPYEDFLKIMLKHVKPGGCVTIAIENKMGLKYFAGCKEDHTGEYFSGIENYPEKGSARTFSRKGLEKILKNCGVEQYSFYYPYPDYKFTSCIYSDKRLPQVGELTDNMRNFDRDRMLLFNEKYAFDGIISEGLFEQYANSYMVIIGKEPETIYSKYSNDRADKYAIRTDIVEINGRKKVQKTAMSVEAREHILNIGRAYEALQRRYAGGKLHINPCEVAEDGSYATFPFEEGTTLEVLMDQCLERDDMDGFQTLFDQYYTYIGYGEDQAVTDYDLIFANILVEGDEWTVIDYEWTFEKPMNTKEIAFRAIYCYVLEEEKRNKLNLELILNKLDIKAEEASAFREQEQDFQKQVTGKRKSLGEIHAGIGTYSVDVHRLVQRYLDEIIEKRVQIYEDFGTGFSEENSYYLPDLYTDRAQVKLDLTVSGDVQALRIDPSDKMCIVSIRELLWNGVTIPLNKKVVTTNGRNIKNDCYVFATEDSNINIQLKELKRLGENKLSALLEVVNIEPDMATAIFESSKRLF